MVSDPRDECHTDFGADDTDRAYPAFVPDPEYRAGHQWPHVSHVIAPNHTVADTADTALAAAFTRVVLAQHRGEAS